MKKEIGIFVDSIRNGYNSKTFTKKICAPRIFNETTDSQKEFFQFPIRISMNQNDFSGGVDSTILGRDLGNDIAFGEFNYITNKLIEAKKVEFGSIIDALKALPDDFEPRAILVPIDSQEYYNEIHMLSGEAKAVYELGGNLFVDFKFHKIEVIWSSSRRPLSDIFIIGRKALTWIYKYKKDMKSIPNIDGYNEDFDDSSSKMSVIYKLKNSKIDFIARVVGLVELDEKRIVRLSLKKEIK